MLGMILGSYNDYLYNEFGFDHLIIVVDIQRKINKKQSHLIVLVIENMFVKCTTMC